ncbi:MAG TPA: tetratricopeptide repeat protein, partial [Dehalococcoidia bacterium]|nr:tetratricopeptide repeat protein [Dehalococcoidia bacterium]
MQAGAGYGKTAFLAGFAREKTGADGVPVAWLTLSRIHLDRIHLLEDLAFALQSVRPGMGTVALDAVHKSKDVHRRWDYFLDLFCQEVHDAGDQPSLLILDQYERVAHCPSTRDTLDRITNALPPKLTLLISTRQPPGLASIRRLGAHDEVWRLAGSDLCFTADEARELLSEWMGLSLSDEALDCVMTRTGGWPAAVQMAGVLALHQGERALLAFTGSQPEFYEHLCEGVFRRQSASVRNYLMCTALVEEVVPALRLVLAEDTTAVGEVARLENGVYPGLPVGTGDGISYHHNPVFRNFLVKELQESVPRRRVGELHTRLAQFYRSTQEWDACLYHFLEAGEYDMASDTLASLAETAITTNRLDTLKGWLEAFPREERNPRPWLLLYEGVIRRIDRDWEKALALYNQAGEVFRERGERKGLARSLWYASQVLAYRGNQRLATMLASEALTYLEPSEAQARAWVLHSMGNCYFDLGQRDQALGCHEEAREIFTSLEDNRGQMMQRQAMAWGLHRLGSLKEAQHHYVQALDMQAKTGDVNMLCWLRAGLAHLRALRGDYSDSLAELYEVVGMAR